MSDEEVFAYDLALQLGIPVGELLERMTAQEFLGWSSFFKLRAEQARNVDREPQHDTTVEEFENFFNGK